MADKKKKKSPPKKPSPQRARPNKPAKPRRREAQGFFRRNKFRIALVLITFLVFANSIPNGYALDDEFYTAHANKETLKGIKGIPDFFTHPTFLNTDGTGYSFRPIALTSFALEIQFFGENPHVSHFINLLLYIITILVLFGLLRRWFITQGDWFAFFVCLLFAVHPLHTEVVDNIKCRDELLAFFFAILTLVFIWKHIKTGKITYAVLYPLCFLAGDLSKKTIMLFFFLIPLSLWFFTELKWKKILLYLAPIIVLWVAHLFFTAHILPDLSRKYQAFENPFARHHIGFFSRTATAAYVAGRYLWLFIIPHPLVYYYGEKYVDTVTWANPIAIASFVIYAGLGVWAFYELRRKSGTGYGLLFFLINIAAFSNLLVAAPGLMAERFMYEASLGFCIVVPFAVFRLLKSDPAAFAWKSPSCRLPRNIFIVIAFLFAARSFWRNFDLESKDVLYVHDMQYLGKSVKANMLLAALYSQQAMEQKHVIDSLVRVGDSADAGKARQKQVLLFEKSRDRYSKAATLAPYYHTAWNNIGASYFFLGDAKSALPYFLKSVSIKPDYDEGLIDVGMAYQQLGKLDSAKYYLSTAIRKDSSSTRAYNALSKLLFQKENNPEEALQLLRLAAKRNPGDEETWNGMALVYIAMGDTAGAVSAGEMAARINPSNLRRLYNLASYFKAHNDIVKANYYMSLFNEQRQKMIQQQQER